MVYKFTPKGRGETINQLTNQLEFIQDYYFDIDSVMPFLLMLNKRKILKLIEKQIDRRSICSTEFQVFLPNNDSEKDFFYGVCNTHYFKYEMMARATGTSSSHQRVRPEDILDISILLPVNDVLFNYHFVTVPIFNKRSVNKRQINYLTQLRDTLLPKLMSGEVRVRDKGIK